MLPLAVHGLHRDDARALVWHVRGAMECRIESRTQWSDGDTMGDVKQILPDRRREDTEEPNGLGVDDLDVIFLVHHDDAERRIQDEAPEPLADVGRARLCNPCRARSWWLGLCCHSCGPDPRRGGAVLRMFISPSVQVERSDPLDGRQHTVTAALVDFEMLISSLKIGLRRVDGFCLAQD